MTSITSTLTRLLAALALTLVALTGSVAVAGVASADDDDRPSSSSSSSHDDDEDDDDRADVPPGPQPVTYTDGDAIDDLGTLVAKKAPKLAPRFEIAAPKLRTALADHLTKKGAQVTYDARGRLVIAPYLCDPKKLKLLQPGCVTSLPTTGGDRF